jgi:hypothetical protein
MSKSGKLCVGGNLLAVLLLPLWASAECIPIAEARAHVGATKCVTGRVLSVTHGDKGVTYLNFCQDYRVCPFQLVVFASDLHHVGDVRQLRGKTIEVHGEIKDYDGRAEIILSQLRQLKGEAARIPPLPKEFDVEKKGRYSAGKFSHPRSSTRTRHKKRQSAPIQTEDPAAAEPPSD